MDSKTQSKFKLAIIGIVVLIIGIAGMMFLWNRCENCVKQREYNALCRKPTTLIFTKGH